MQLARLLKGKCGPLPSPNKDTKAKCKYNRIGLVFGCFALVSPLGAEGVRGPVFRKRLDLCILAPLEKIKG